MFKRFRRGKKRTNSNDLEVNGEELNIDDAEVEKLKNLAENMEEEEIKKHGKYFSADKLWEKIKKYSKKAGISVIYIVLLLYYTLQKPEVPKSAKAIIIGAMGYFILPIDLIPDVTPGIGFADDLGVLTAALLQIAIHIDSDIKNQAKNQLKQWFGENIDTSTVDAKI